MTIRPETRFIQHRGIRLGADSSDDAVDRLRRAVYLALDEADETGLEMAIETIHLAVG